MSQIKKEYLFTSESVSEGHPDKVADQISDAILDACMEQDPESRVALETLCTTDFILLAGEVRTNAVVNWEAIARGVVRDIGYTDPEIGFAADTDKNIALRNLQDILCRWLITVQIRAVFLQKRHLCTGRIFPEDVHDPVIFRHNRCDDPKRAGTGRNTGRTAAGKQHRAE